MLSTFFGFSAWLFFHWWAEPRIAERLALKRFWIVQHLELSHSPLSPNAHTRSGPILYYVRNELRYNVHIMPKPNGSRDSVMRDTFLHYRIISFCIFQYFNCIWLILVPEKGEIDFMNWILIKITIFSTCSMDGISSERVRMSSLPKIVLRMVYERRRGRDLRTGFFN